MKITIRQYIYNILIWFARNNARQYGPIASGLNYGNFPSYKLVFAHYLWLFIFDTKFGRSSPILAMLGDKFVSGSYACVRAYLFSSISINCFYDFTYRNGTYHLISGLQMDDKCLKNSFKMVQVPYLLIFFFFASVYICCERIEKIIRMVPFSHIHVSRQYFPFSICLRKLNNTKTAYTTQQC